MRANVLSERKKCEEVKPTNQLRPMFTSNVHKKRHSFFLIAPHKK